MQYFKTFLSVLVFLVVEKFERAIVPHERIELWTKDIIDRFTGVEQTIPAKFSDTCSIRADGQCIGCLGQWAERGRENSNMQEFFCTTL